MKTIEITNQQLYDIHVEFQNLAPRPLGLLLAPRLNEFYRRNGLRVNTLINKITEVQENFVEMEGGKPKMQKSEEGKETVIFLPGKDSQGLNEAYKELMTQSNRIDI